MCVSYMYPWSSLVETYQRSSTDGEGAGRAALDTVGSGHDSVGIEESTTAPMAAIVGDANNEGELSRAGRGSANDVGDLLGLGGSSDQRGREGNESGDLDHGDDVEVSKSSG